MKRGTLIAVNLALALAYFATAKLGLALNSVGGFATVVWLPSGIALAALLVLGFRVWPGIFVGALLLNLSYTTPQSTSPYVAAMAGVFISIGNTLEPLLGAYLLKRMGFRSSLERVVDVLGFVIAAAGLSTMVSPTIGATALWAAGMIPAIAVPGTWATWWLGDALGVLLAASTLLVWTAPIARSARMPGRAVEAAALGFALVACSLAIHFSFTGANPEYLVLKPYLVFPLLVWAALRFGPRGTVTTIVAVAVLGLARTVASFHAAPSAEFTLGLTLTQVFDGIAAATTMVLAAAISERRQAEAVATAASEAKSVEIDERKRAESALQLLSDAGRSLSESLDFALTVEKVARLALPMLADWCVVDVVEDAMPKRVAALHVDAEKAALMTELLTSHPLRWDSSEPAATVLRDRKSVAYPSLTEETRASLASSKEHADLLRRIGVESLLVVPMLARDRTLGVITFGRSGEGRTYRENDVSLAQELADRAAVAILNADLYREAHDVIRVRDENQTLHTLVRILSHDLANTVQGVLYFSMEAERSYDKSDKVRECGAQLVQLANAQAGMIRHARDAYRARSEPRRLKTQPVDLGEVVLMALSLFGEAIREKELQVVNDVPRRVHFADAESQTLTHQVVANLMSNAIKFTPRGKRIEIRVEERNGSIVLVVADEGIGMKSDAMDANFKEGRTESRPGTEGEAGTGFGLLQVRHFVDVYGGRVELSSRTPEGDTPGGTTFKIVLKKVMPGASATAT